MMNITEIVEAVKKSAPKGSSLLIQLPEGLKTRAIEIIDSLEENGYSAVLSNDPCYGACDIRDREARMAGCDMIIHIGHAKFHRDFKTEIPVVYIPLELEADFSNEELKKIRESIVGVVTTVNYEHILDSICTELEKIDKKHVAGGYVLGCWAENVKRIEKDVDCFLFIGTGRFHPLAIRSEKPVYVFDLERNVIVPLHKDMKRQKILLARIEELKDAKSVGIMVSSKQGQFYAAHQDIALKIRAMGKKAYILIMDYTTNENLMGLKIDFFINTACPRIAEDSFDRSVMNVEDFLENIK